MFGIRRNFLLAVASLGLLAAAVAPALAFDGATADEPALAPRPARGLLHLAQRGRLAPAYSRPRRAASLHRPAEHRRVFLRHRGVRVHRGLLQPPTAALVAGVLLASGV